MEYFEQHAQGKFSVEVTGPFHCGPNHDSPKQFDFEVLIQYPSQSLDQHGFLLDNMAFQEYFESLGSLDASCERLAHVACLYFWQATHKRAYRVYTAVWGIPGHAKVAYAIPAPLWKRFYWTVLTLVKRGN